MGISLAPNTGALPTSPLPTEYPSAPSTTGTPQNRLQLAQNAFNTFAKSTAPQYTADLRQATQQAAGNGQEGSGQLRTTYGNLANQRALALDTEQQNLINSATAATIGDQQAQRGLDIQQQGANTAQAGTYGNLALGQGQLGLATGEAIGNVGGAPTLAAGNLKIDQQNADTVQAAQRSQAALGQGQLGLATTAQAQANAIQTAGLTGILNGTATLQAKQDAVNQAVAQGQLTVQQGQLALSQLSQAQSNALGQGQLALAQTAQQTQAAQTQQQIDLARLSESDQTALAKAGLTGIMQDGTATLQAKQDAIQNALAQGQLSNAQAQTAIQALSQQATATNQAGQLALQQQQLAQVGTEFGLTQAQNLQLAQLANQTQNRQIDVSSAQGQHALLLQLASIMGGPAGSLDPAFVQTIMNALGLGGQAAPSAAQQPIVWAPPTYTTPSQPYNGGTGNGGPPLSSGGMPI